MSWTIDFRSIYFQISTSISLTWRCFVNSTATGALEGQRGLLGQKQQQYIVCKNLVHLLVYSQRRCHTYILLLCHHAFGHDYHLQMSGRGSVKVPEVLIEHSEHPLCTEISCAPIFSCFQVEEIQHPEAKFPKRMADRKSKEGTSFPQVSIRLCEVAHIVRSIST